MKPRIHALAAILLGWSLSGCALGVPNTAPPPRTLVIRGGWLFDGTGDTIVRSRGIVIRDSILVQVNQETDEGALEGAEVLELSDDQYIIPGMFDLHAHYAVDLFGRGRVDETRVYPALFLANGVTSTFPAGEVSPDEMGELKLRIESGDQAGPRLFRSGPYFGSARQGWTSETTAEQIRAEVDYWVAQGVHGFKAKGIRPEHLRALIDAAHAHGRTVTGHLDSGVRNSVNPRDAILMGIDRIEHFEGGDAITPDRPAYSSLVEMTPDMPEFREIVELYKDSMVYYNATLSAYGYYGRRDPEVYTYFAPEMDFLTPYARAEVERGLPRPVHEQFERIYWVKRDLLKAFYEMGGGHLITLGTDHPSWGEFFSGFSVHRELHTMVLAGIPPAAALRAATLNASEALRLADRLGTLERGKLADLVVINGNPLEDIRNTRNTHRVIKNGEVYDPQALLAAVQGKLGPRNAEEKGLW